MVKRFLGVEISFQFYYFALLTIVLIFDKSGGIFCCFLSSFFHEIGHLLAILVLKQKVDRIEFSLFDIKIKSNEEEGLEKRSKRPKKRKLRTKNKDIKDIDLPMENTDIVQDIGSDWD